jgi:hypothetical protein
MNAKDPSGLDWLDTMANFWAGVGDSLTFGATDWIREQFGADEVVDKQSCAYRVGEYTEVAAEIALAGGSKLLTRMALRKIGSYRKEATQVIKALGLKRAGYQVHHVNPLMGHPFGGRTLFPTAGLPRRIHSGRWNLRLLDTAAHRRAHQRVRQVEQALRITSNRYTTTVRLLNNVRRDFEQRCKE